jgi:hypothetical protein
VNDIIRSGYRLFIKSHEWTFLKPTKELILPDGEQDVDLPADFGFLIGDIYFLDDELSRLTPIERKNDGAIKQLRQQGPVIQSQPRMCAVIPNNGPTTTKGQRSILMVWPTPEQEYTVTFRYSVLPAAIDVTHPYPYGGAAHAETLIQACLAASEEFNDTPGSSMQAFARELRTSIEYDRKAAAQQIDNLDGRYDKRRRTRDDMFPLSGISTYNGLYSA